MEFWHQHRQVHACLYEESMDGCTTEDQCMDRPQAWVVYVWTMN